MVVINPIEPITVYNVGVNQIFALVVEDAFHVVNVFILNHFQNLEMLDTPKLTITIISSSGFETA